MLSNHIDAVTMCFLNMHVLELELLSKLFKCKKKKKSCCLKFFKFYKLKCRSHFNLNYVKIGFKIS